MIIKDASNSLLEEAGNNMRVNIPNRKYINSREKDALITVLSSKDLKLRLLCSVLLYTGCRISECLALTPANWDLEEGNIYIKSLKKRRDNVYRRVPIPQSLVELLILVQAEHQLRDDDRIWNWSRMTAYRHVKAVMCESGVREYQSSPKALRHGFAVTAVENGIPMNLVQRWLGHADQKTTAIYADLVGAEERNFASRTWGDRSSP
ncbi:tyrosine-type recombinase/integrase [Brucella sp. 22210]|uniref:tyrosine-type recombinase/integrase n=1 Tax=Brucella sp. 22210 TaxID=3453892 RepID=UPI003F85D228